MSGGTLDAAERAALEKLADALIPPGAGGAMSAAQAGVAGWLFAAAEVYEPDLAERLRPVLAGAASREPEAALAALKAADQPAYDLFCETVAAIYFMSPAVRAQIGYGGREPKPARTDVADMEDLLMPVLEAGFAPRPTPA